MKTDRIGLISYLLIIITVFTWISPSFGAESNIKTPVTYYSNMAHSIKSLDDKTYSKSDMFSAWEKQLSEKSLPAGIVDLDSFYRNLDKITAAFENSPKKFRVATKSVRVPFLIHEIVKRTKSNRVFCYSAQEAEFLYSLNDHDVQIDDFLIAYPTVQKADIAALRRLQDKGAKVSLVLDSEEQMQMISATLSAFDKTRDPSKNAPLPLRILIDYDMSIDFLNQSVGTKRSPIKTEDDLRTILRASKKYPALKVVGVMAYEAVVAGITDENPDTPLENLASKKLREFAVPKIAEKRALVPQIFKEEKVPLEIFNGGGTGSINFAIQEDVLTEVTAGSGFLCSHLFDDYSNLNATANSKEQLNFKFEPALYFAVQLVRFPSSDMGTAAGGGIVASGDIGMDRLPKAVWPESLKLTKMEGAGEVQTPIAKERHGDVVLTLGQPIIFRPAKAGEPAERFNTYLLSSHGEFVGEALTYRGFGKCFG